MNVRPLPLLLAISASLAIPAAQAATTGTLRFAGQVDAGTCNLAAGDENRTVTLPTVKISDFDSAVFTGAMNFEITAECESDIRNVIFLLTGTPSVDNGLLFANVGTSGGTALWLRSGASGATFPANGSPADRSRTIATSGNKAVLPMWAAYHVTGKAITQGTLDSTATVSITYN